MSLPNEEASAALGAAAAPTNETLTAEEMEERKHFEKVNESITQLKGIMIDPDIVLQKIEELDEMKKKTDYEEACIKEYLSEINKKYEDITAIANNLRGSMDEMKENNREYAQNVGIDWRTMCDTQNSVNTELEKMKEEMMDVDMEAELQNTAQDEFVKTTAQEREDEPSKQENE